MFANRVIGGVHVPCVVFYAAAVVGIIAYGYMIRKHKKRDIFEKKIVDSPSCVGFDGWGVLHALFFLMIGFVYPGRYLQCLVVSLGWEAIEHSLGTNDFRVSGKRLQLIGDQDEDGNPIEEKEGAEPVYWYARFLSDPFFNLFGYILGTRLAERYWPDKDYYLYRNANDRQYIKNL